MRRAAWTAVVGLVAVAAGRVQRRWRRIGGDRSAASGDDDPRRPRLSEASTSTGSTTTTSTAPADDERRRSTDSRPRRIRRLRHLASRRSTASPTPRRRTSPSHGSQLDLPTGTEVRIVRGARQPMASRSDRSSSSMRMSHSSYVDRLFEAPVQIVRDRRADGRRRAPFVTNDRPRAGGGRSAGIPVVAADADRRRPRPVGVGARRPHVDRASARSRMRAVGRPASSPCSCRPRPDEP